MRYRTYWLAGMLLIALTACGQKADPNTADNSSLPGHVGSRADKTTPMTEPTPGNASGETQHGATGAPTRNDTGAGGDTGSMKAQGTTSQAPQH